jgi:hypothetical protein
MKYVMIFAAIISLNSTASAVVSTEPVVQQYTFKFNYKEASFEIKNKSSSYEDAFDKAADLCFEHFKKSVPKMNEDIGLSIIDVCANPRS